MSYTENYLLSVTPTQIEVESLVNCLVSDAIELNASDLHIEPLGEAISVRLRISNRLVELTHLPITLKDKLSGRFKVIGAMQSHITGIGQHGKCNMGPDYQNVQLRISIMPTLQGENIVCRIFNPTLLPFDLNHLGFDDHTLKRYLQLLEEPNGLILVNGPSGSGKTTVMYSSLVYQLERLGTQISVASVEDPVEVQFESVSQAALNPRADFDFAAALKCLLTQDCEVIMVGELPDRETARTAVQAGLSGKLVISTLPAPDSAGVFDRLMSMDIENYLVSSSILGVLGIRLIRRTCTECAEPDEAAAKYLDGLSEERLASANFLKGRGCEACGHSGFAGRIFLTELLKVGGAVRDAILEERSAKDIMKVADEHGMRTLWDNGIEKVLTGETTLQEVTRNVKA